MKVVHEFSRVFLLENHFYRREASIFNDKLERTQIPKIMISTNSLRAYDIEKETKTAEIFDSNGESMFDNSEFFDTHDDKILKGMSRKLIFHEHPYL